MLLFDSEPSLQPGKPISSLILTPHAGETQLNLVQMKYVQATQGGGGWPMSVFLTPTLQPFLGGTYFPPEDSYGRPGFATVLQRVAEAWHSKREDIMASSADVVAQLEAATRSEGTRHFAAAVDTTKCRPCLEDAPLKASRSGILV